MPAASIRFHPEVSDDLESATIWYADRSPATAERFLAAFDSAIDGIRRYPLASERRDDGSRFKRTAGFPFAVVYDLEPLDAVIVLAVAHLSRDDYWSARRSQ